MKLQHLMANRLVEGHLGHEPIFQHFLADPWVNIQWRGTDPQWHYSGLTGRSISGFNPLTGDVFAGARSRLAQWLARPDTDLRDLNEGDWLLKEFFFLQHDYLHVWTYHLINELMPELGFGRTPLDEECLEDFAFCHMLSEVAATVGLDYWHLCTLDLNERYDVGTALGGLTVTYHEDDLDEFRRFLPDFYVQDEAFFFWLVKVYCAGSFGKFEVNAARQSPKLFQWALHELGYGVKQRLYTRQWLRWLKGDGCRAGNDAPINLGMGWMPELAYEVGVRLWSMVKEGAKVSFGKPLMDYWRSPADMAPDYRMLNLQRVPVDPSESAYEGLCREGLAYLFHQTIGQTKYEDIDPTLHPLILAPIQEEDFSFARYNQLLGLLAHGTHIEAYKGEPRDLFLLN